MLFWYGNVQFLAYALETRPGVDGGSYLARTNNQNDVRTRSDLMRRAAEVARAEASASSNCLKVFVAPEFYFRGQTGAYDLDDYQLLVRELRTWAGNARWSHWVFFFGTAVTTFLNDRGEREILNVALIHRGGTADATIAVLKEALAPDDFLSRAKVLHGAHGALAIDDIVGLKDGNAFNALRNRGDGAELQQYGFDGRGIFDLAGVRWGVEVCADHLVGRLGMSPTGQLSWRPQIHVVTSCGSRITPENIVASSGGYLFHCDGEGGGGKFTAARVLRTGVRDVNDLEIIARDHVVDLTDDHVNADWQRVFTERGRVAVFPAQPIPWASLRWT